MDIAEYERLIELAGFRENVRASLAEAKRGEVVAHEQIVRESKSWLKQATKKNIRSNGQ